MKRLRYERRIQLLALAAGLPGSLIAILLLWFGDYSSQAAWTLTILILIFCLGFALSLRNRVVFSLQTLSNLLAAMREEDFSIRARGARSDDALGEVMLEVNEIDVAIFTFDGSRTLKLVNRAGERLLARPTERLLGFTATELGLEGCLNGEPARTVELSFAGGTGRWGLRRGSFRQDGLPHDLIVLSDLSRTLREEERQAWQRLIRVLGHEMNNSLAPIQSVAQSLESNLQRAQREGPVMSEAADTVLDDLRQGLAIIRSRTESLGRFMAAYGRLARLPSPTLAPVELRELVKRVAGIETRTPVRVVEGPPITVQADRDQLEQLLINLIRNATEAVLETDGEVVVRWTLKQSQVQLSIIDDGPGLSNTTNLFVPFFTTKPGGSGIGLVLCRQIAEAHGGSLTLENRQDCRGCVARFLMNVS